ncbi:MAG TPA: ATP-binding protein, partial [Candidatus Hypogeohydataceae bacterium YC40]
MQPTIDKSGTIKNLPPEGTRWELQEKVSTSGLKKMAKRTFKEFAANLEELIANAYDEDATTVEIIYDENNRTLSVKDDGNGMNAAQLESYVCYGESKKTKDYRSPKLGRAPIGEFGMGGKLAIFNLCKRCIISTAREGQRHKFNMSSIQLDSAKYLSDVKREVFSTPCALKLHGTEIFMEDLNYKRILTDSLYERLAMKMPRSLNFRIFLTVKSNGVEERREVEEVLPEMERQFPFEQALETIGLVRLEIFYTKDPIPYTKQGIWTKVNGRIVNENQEWFGLDKLTSGNRYRWRLFGYGYADGLKDYINFSKSGFIEGSEYKAYCEFVSDSLKKVQNELLKMDETVARQKEREIIKRVEKEVNEWVARLNRPDTQKKLTAQIYKIHTEEMENAPDEP